MLLQERAGKDLKLASFHQVGTGVKRRQHLNRVQMVGHRVLNRYGAIFRADLKLSDVQLPFPHSQKPEGEERNHDAANRHHDAKK